jgi:hypothetical protein
MAILDFDFHPPTTRPTLAGVLLLLAGLAAVAAAIASVRHADAARTDLQEQVALQEQAVQKRVPNRSLAKRNASRSEAAKLARARVVATLEYSWEPMFKALEATQSKKIALLSLDANQTKKQVRVVAEARTLTDAVEYIGLLQRQPAIKRALLQQHEVQSEPAEHPVRFTLLLEMRA